MRTATIVLDSTILLCQSANSHMAMVEVTQPHNVFTYIEFKQYGAELSMPRS